MNLIKLATIYLETYFENRTESCVKDMKQFFDEKLGSTTNENTFYTIIRKLKEKGILIPGESRGMYKWNRETKIDKEQLQSASQFVGNRETKINRKQLQSASHLVKEMVSLIKIDEEYYNMMNGSHCINLWSMTPELSECLQILRKIADGKEKLDNIVKTCN